MSIIGDIWLEKYEELEARHNSSRAEIEELEVELQNMRNIATEYYLENVRLLDENKRLNDLIFRLKLEGNRTR